MLKLEECSKSLGEFYSWNPHPGFMFRVCEALSIVRIMP